MTLPDAIMSGTIVPEMSGVGGPSRHSTTSLGSGWTHRAAMIAAASMIALDANRDMFLPSVPSEMSSGIDVSIGTVLTPSISDAVDASHAAQVSIKAFADRLGRIPQVERVLLRIDEDAMRLWIVLDEINIEAENEVYDLQLGLLDALPDVLLDFSMIFRSGRDYRSVIPLGTIDLFLRV